MPGLVLVQDGCVARQPTRKDMAEAAALLRRLLELVDAGELEATTPKAIALVRRLEGAAAAFEVAGGQDEPGLEL